MLFCKERNPEKELWDGFLVGPEGAIERYGFDDAFPIADIDDILPGMIEAAAGSTIRWARIRHSITG